MCCRDAIQGCLKGSITQMNEEEEYYVVPVVPSSDVQHTEDSLFCDDGSCPCHEDQELIGVVAQQVTDGLMTPAEADRYYRGETL